jgi:hypothetical protein
MKKPLRLASLGIQAAVLAIALCVGGIGYAQDGGPFARLGGEWSGSGTIDMADGSREPIKCRAAYDILSEQQNLQLNIRCASDSYNFDLRGSATLAANAVSGSWSESTRNAAGNIKGTAQGDRVDVVAKGPGFAARLTLVTRGNKQSVTIKSQDAETSVKGATISLQRS